MFRKTVKRREKRLIQLKKTFLAEYLVRDSFYFSLDIINKKKQVEAFYYKSIFLLSLGHKTFKYNNSYIHTLVIEFPKETIAVLWIRTSVNTFSSIHYIEIVSGYLSLFISYNSVNTKNMNYV